MGKRHKKPYRWGPVASLFRQNPCLLVCIVALLLAGVTQRLAYHREYLERSVLAQSPISDAASYHEMAKDLAQEGKWDDPQKPPPYPGLSYDISRYL